LSNFHAVAKALADPQRFEILEHIAQAGEVSCGEVAAECPISQATVSHHLKVLVDAGLVSVRRQGQRSIFSANPEVLETYMAELKSRTAALVPARAATG
jgi:ArsR family transcriptional regulator, arsenate/arsenite/antimonite-responsive transcriptional repressor